jgi:hypothetical protein
MTGCVTINKTYPCDKQHIEDWSIPSGTIVPTYGGIDWGQFEPVDTRNPYNLIDNWSDGDLQITPHDDYIIMWNDSLGNLIFSDTIPNK